MYLLITKLSVASMLLAGIVFFNQSVLNAEQNKSPHYEKGVVKIATKGGKTGTINWKTRYITSKGIAVTTSHTTNSSQKNYWQGEVPLLMPKGTCWKQLMAFVLILQPQYPIT